MTSTGAINEGRMGLEMELGDDPLHDYQSPQREAAFFFGLFLRGHSADKLRQDIDFPPELMTKWRRHENPQAPSKEDLQRVFEFRKRVLAIFNFLVNSETGQVM